MRQYVTIHRVLALAATLLTLALAPSVAHAYSAAPGYTAHDYVTGFPFASCCHWGPVGVAFDQSDNLYVADVADGNVYRFEPGGGHADRATRLTSSPLPGLVEGLAFTRDGHLYAARYNAGDVVELDPATGAIRRVVAGGMPCATGIAVDPASGDLFVSQNLCGNTIFRISGFAHGPGTVSAYTNLPDVDGIAFDPGGTLYAARGGEVDKISSPGVVTNVAFVHSSDGVAFGTAAGSSSPPFVVVNRNDGHVTRVDLTHYPSSQSDILSGGSRGDFVAVDSHGCLFATQTDRIVRIAPSGGACNLSPSTLGPLPAPGVALDLASRSALGSGGCVRLRRLVFRLRERGRVRLRSAVVYVNGRRVKRLKGRAVVAPITLSHLPSGAFTVKVVATTTSGRRLTTRNRYRNCSSFPHCVNTRALTLHVARVGGAPVVRVDAYVDGRHVKTVHGADIRTLVLHGLPQRRFVVRIVARTSSGRHHASVATYVGCRRAKRRG